MANDCRWSTKLDLYLEYVNYILIEKVDELVYNHFSLSIYSYFYLFIFFLNVWNR